MNEAGKPGGPKKAKVVMEGLRTDLGDEGSTGEHGGVFGGQH